MAPIIRSILFCLFIFLGFTSAFPSANPGPDPQRNSNNGGPKSEELKAVTSQSFRPDELTCPNSASKATIGPNRTRSIACFHGAITFGRLDWYTVNVEAGSATFRDLGWYYPTGQVGFGPQYPHFNVHNNSPATVHMQAWNNRARNGTPDLTLPPGPNGNFHLLLNGAGPGWRKGDQLQVKV
ncbi:hypothetical protein B0J12DRAFT_672867 [Macrophomina phaseolina]|uniref:Uncharacterized protein n=1 Tax=Macrophomina phaseolina TaxID=35725 RepID=A0ABQ8G3R8_9PEZI|nr:hypothetical protein B0J12DRAFT_672867 [Macrophomina phaseolina]